MAIDEDAAMELRVAAISYKLDHDGMSCNKLSEKAKLTGDQQALPRFLHGQSSYFADHRKLASFLVQEGYLPLKTQITGALAYAQICGLFRNSTDDIMSEAISAIIGDYDKYQWSSTRPGLVLVSKFSIIHQNGELFARVTERQVAGSNVENFDGCCFCTGNKLIFIMRERRQKRPKFMMCKYPSDEEFINNLSGLIIKVGTTKSFHMTPVYMEREDRDVPPGLRFFADLTPDLKSRLSEPLTPFNLAGSQFVYSEIKDELYRIMERFHVKKIA